MFIIINLQCRQYSDNLKAWWRHQMETFSALLAFCAGNSPGTGEFPAQRPVTWSFEVFFDLRPNKRVSKQSWGWWSETPSSSLWRYHNETCLNHVDDHVSPSTVHLHTGNLVTNDKHFQTVATCTLEWNAYSTDIDRWMIQIDKLFTTNMTNNQLSHNSWKRDVSRVYNAEFYVSFILPHSHLYFQGPDNNSSNILIWHATCKVSFGGFGPLGCRATYSYLGAFQKHLWAHKSKSSYIFTCE